VSLSPNRATLLGRREHEPITSTAARRDDIAFSESGPQGCVDAFWQSILQGQEGTNHMDFVGQILASSWSENWVAIVAMAVVVVVVFMSFWNIGPTEVGR
jgi:hypothetical protein